MLSVLNDVKSKRSFFIRVDIRVFKHDRCSFVISVLEQRLSFKVKMSAEKNGSVRTHYVTKRPKNSFLCIYRRDTN